MTSYHFHYENKGNEVSHMFDYKDKALAWRNLDGILTLSTHDYTYIYIQVDIHLDMKLSSFLYPNFSTFQMNK